MISANIPNKTRKAVYRRDGYQCALCSDIRGLQIHHVVPRSEGGSDDAQNLITLCWRCHAGAHGSNVRGNEGFDEGAFALACVEYVADLYAEQGIIWYPYETLPF